MSLVERITKQRLDKLGGLRARGIDPYPARCRRSHSNAQAVALLEKQEQESVESIEISVAGRITANRDIGKLCFINITDGSGGIQLFINKALLSEESITLLKDIDIGDFISATGKVIRTRTGEPSIEAKQLTLLSKSLQPLPEKWHGLQDTETRYRQRYVDLISNSGAKEIFRKRSRVISAMRRYLDSHGFLEVETPILQPSAGGALARPFITHHNALDCNFYLRIALELHLKRLLVGGFDRVYEIGRVFRNEGIDTRHNPEFTLMECYQAYADYNDVMHMVEEMLSDIVKEVTGDYKIPFGSNLLDFTPPWPRLDLRQAILDKCGIDYDKFPDAASLAAEMRRHNIEFDPSRDRGRLIDDLLSTFVEPTLVNPVFLINYPIDMSPLAKNKPGDAHTVERFEAYAGCTEIANAFSELNDPIEQERRFAGQLQDHTNTYIARTEEIETMDEDFITALEYGMPPTGGLGIGIDRIVMLVTNQLSIREVILFPTLKEKEAQTACRGKE
ncbi:MAG: lysine--tRNA ligase [Dehalococcoidia bacterium]|nr:lysine--tRNA ligase [Dehalococcoidia bacterium]